MILSDAQEAIKITRHARVFGENCSQSDQTGKYFSEYTLRVLQTRSGRKIVRRIWLFV